MQAISLINSSTRCLRFTSVVIANTKVLRKYLYQYSILVLTCTVPLAVSWCADTVALGKQGKTLLRTIQKNGNEVLGVLKKTGNREADVFAYIDEAGRLVVYSSDDLDRGPKSGERVLTETQIDAVLEAAPTAPPKKIHIVEDASGNRNVVESTVDDVFASFSTELREWLSRQGPEVKTAFVNKPTLADAWKKLKPSSISGDVKYLEYIHNLPPSWKYEVVGDVVRVKDTKGKLLAELSPNGIKASGGKKGEWNQLLSKELKLNSAYDIDGYVYKTDDYGRVASAEGDVAKQARDRLTSQQGKSVEIKDGIDGDEGGHIFGARFNGPGEQINYWPQRGNLNKGPWKQMEDKWAKAINEGKTVRVEIKAIFEGTSKRPSAFEVNYWIDGVKKPEFFSN